MKATFKQAVLPILGLMGIASGYIYAQSTAAPPAISVPETIHNFGMVEPGAEVTYDFPIKNIGGRNLQIRQIHASCGCVKDAHIDMDSIPGGKAGYLHVVWLPSGGELNEETISIQSSDPKVPQSQVTIKAQIKAAFSVSPAVVNYGLLERSDLPSPREVGVEKVGAVPSDATLKFQSSAPYVETSSTKTATGKWKLNLLVKPNAPVGPLDGRLTIIPSWPGATPYNVIILGKVLGSVGADPDEIYIETGDAGQKFRRSLKIAGDGVKVQSIMVQPLDAELQRVATTSVEGDTINVEFSLNGVTTPNTFHSRVLCDVTLDNGKKETILIPISLVR